MLGFGRNHAGDRFYSSPAIRRQKQIQLEKLHRPEKPKVPENRVESGELPENRTDFGDSPEKPSVCSSQARIPSGNLDRFLESTTPVVPAQYFSKTSMRGCRNYDDAELNPYFSLGDLWESFKEWSAYGAGVPLLLNGSDSVVQYYVPYLSGIQLYVDSSKPSLRSRRPGDESDDSYRDTSSDGSSDCEVERQSKIIAEGVRNQHNLTESNTQRINRISLRDRTLVGQECFSSDDGEVCSPHGHMAFEYLERDPPYSREPLADKISVLACQFPELMTYRSCDLLPASWISVAWYPIYRIPTGPTLRDLEASFLTFHTLSTRFRGSSNVQPQILSSSFRKVSTVDISAKLSLPVFGLASYKFKG
ncbi:uncharacterized protein LOC143849761 isoform X2 [Tasmannia lanceolata]